MRTVSKALLLSLLLILFSPPLSHGQGGDDPPADPTTSLPPAAQDLKFEHLTAEQGLSNNRVLSILKDSTGFMWFGTFDGLNRYDGYEFKVFRHDPEDENSLSANVIEVVYEDQSGSLWIGTSGGGLNRFDPKTERFTHYRHDPDDPRSLGSDTVFAIYQDREGDLWIGTGGGGLNLYDPESDGFTRYQHDPDNPSSLSGNAVRAILEDSQGVLWIGTDSNGLNRFDRDASAGGAFTSYRHNPDDPHSLGHDSVAVIHEDRTGDLWIGLWGGGLDRLDRERAGGQVARFTHYRHDPEHPGSLSHNVVSSLYQDPAGNLWVGTAGGGLNKLDRQTGHFYQFQSNPDDPHSLSHDFVRTMYGDPTGLLWVGSTGGGISILDFERKAFAHYRNIPGDPDSLNSNDVMGIYVDPEGALWVGTGSGGLNRFDRQRLQVSRYVHDPDDPHSLSHNMVREIVQDARGNLWLATAEGLNRFDPQGGQFTAYRQDPAGSSGLLSDNVLTIHAGPSGLFWVGTWFGLNRVDPLVDEIVHFRNDPDDPDGLSGEALVSIYEDQAGVLWLGTFGAGLIRFEPQTGRTARYQHDADDPHSLADNTVFAIHQDSAGNLWLGTSAGLDRFDRDFEQFIHYGEKDGLPAAGVASILEDDLPPEQGGPYLWISTSKGLSRFNPQTGAVRNYDVSDGLQGNDFVWGSAFKSEDGELFFGGTNGLTAFYPSQIVDNSYIPPVVITDFQLANRPVEIGEDSVLKQSVGETEQLTLSYQDRVISFEFAALNYRAPGKNRYRYILEGFDEEWTETGSDRRFVTYTNLDPGDYVFRVLGSNNDGVWNEEGASIRITVTPPWWGTWWFRGGLVLLLVALVAGGFGWQRANARWRERYLEARLAEQTWKLDERVKELECLYSISTLAAQTDISLDEILQGTVALLPPAWQHPEIACARLEVDGQEYTTENYQASDWRQSADIMVHGERAGEVEVRYLEPRLDADEGPFITEERLLLNAVAERVGRITERIRAERALRRTHGELSTILTISREITRTLDLDALLELILSEAERLITYDGAGIFTLGEETLNFRYYHGINLEADLLSLRIPIKVVTPFRELALNGKPFIYDDLHDDPELATQLLEATGLSLKALFGDCHSWLSVPLMLGERVIGLLAFIHIQPGHYQVEDQELAQVFANQAAIAIENARLYQESQKTAVLEERSRLARDLHDSATQALYSALLFSETGKKLAEAGNLESAAYYQSRVSQVVGQALKEMRLLVFELSPPELEREGLVGALRLRLETVENRSGVEARLHAVDLPPLPGKVSEGLYRIALEALNNILKHAQADTVTVQLGFEGELLTLAVIDDGQGFDPNAVQNGGLGLTSMQERADSLGADLSIDSAPGQGTRVRVSLGVRGKMENPQ